MPPTKRGRYDTRQIVLDMPESTKMHMDRFLNFWDLAGFPKATVSSAKHYYKVLMDPWNYGAGARQPDMFRVYPSQTYHSVTVNEITIASAVANAGNACVMVNPFANSAIHICDDTLGTWGALNYVTTFADIDIIEYAALAALWSKIRPVSYGIRITDLGQIDTSQGAIDVAHCVPGMGYSHVDSGTFNFNSRTPRMELAQTYRSLPDVDIFVSGIPVGGSIFKSWFDVTHSHSSGTDAFASILVWFHGCEPGRKYRVEVTHNYEGFLQFNKQFEMQEQPVATPAIPDAGATELACDALVGTAPHTMGTGDSEADRSKQTNSWADIMFGTARIVAETGPIAVKTYLDIRRLWNRDQRCVPFCAIQRFH